MNVLVVIPARGGSEGVPRKNLRSLAERPLIYYSINTALKSTYSPDVYVSSDDQEILAISENLGAKTIQRDQALADSATTLDPVIFDAYSQISNKENKVYQVIVTLQPTSPLLTTESLDEAIGLLITNPSLDTIISATNDTHLTWTKTETGFTPNYEQRLNRQQLPACFRETGGFLICRDTVITNDSRIGDSVSLFELSNREAIDIDTYEDLNLCEYYLSRKTILFVLTGHTQVGLGHVYRALTIANRIIDHELRFLLDSSSTLGLEKIKESKYRASLQQRVDISEDILEISPDIVINDQLDTSSEYVEKLKSHNIKVINFEDLGEGAQHADLVINDLYPEQRSMPNHFYGPAYFCARDEFLITEPRPVHQSVKTVLITFGGTDPNNLTRKVLDSIYDFCQQNAIKLVAVLGIGYEQTDTLAAFPSVEILTNIRNMSQIMRAADIAFTSAGRTIYELACVGTPAIVLAQNQRETTHFWASKSDGYAYMGLGSEVSEDRIYQTFYQLMKDYKLRKHMQEQMLSTNIKESTSRVIKLLKSVIEV